MQCSIVAPEKSFPHATWTRLPSWIPHDFGEMSHGASALQYATSYVDSVHAIQQRELFTLIEIYRKVPKAAAAAIEIDCLGAGRC